MQFCCDFIKLRLFAPRACKVKKDDDECTGNDGYSSEFSRGSNLYKDGVDEQAEFLLQAMDRNRDFGSASS